MKPIVTLVVAAAQNDVIGKDNNLPWHLPRDLKYFKTVTTGCPILMGRKTYESIGKALPNRLNIVITRNTDYVLPDAEVVHGIEAAIALAKQQQPNAREIHIIGGAAIFAAALPLVDKLYLNRVLADIDGDTYLPPIDWSAWSLTHSEQHTADEDHAYALDFQVYRRYSG